MIDYICIAPFKGPKAALHGEQTNKQTNVVNKYIVLNITELFCFFKSNIYNKVRMHFLSYMFNPLVPL